MKNHLAEVDEVHKRGEITGPDIGQEEDGVLGRVDRAEDVLEVAGAGAQDDPMRFHRVTFARKGHISKVFVLPVGFLLYLITGDITIIPPTPPPLRKNEILPPLLLTHLFSFPHFCLYFTLLLLIFPALFFITIFGSSGKA